MPLLRIALSVLILLLMSSNRGNAQEQDAIVCFNTADRVRDGESVAQSEREAAHESCLRALAATASIVQKYQLQEADFDVMGTRPKKSP